MNVRLMFAAALIASSSMFAAPAAAHDPAQFDRMMKAGDAPKSATACEALAEPGNAKYPDTAEAKALKARCEAEKEAAAKKGVSESKSK